MIELPDLSNPFTHENNFYLTSDIFTMSKLMSHYEFFRELLNKSAAKKVIGFDALGEFPATTFKTIKNGEKNS